MVLSHRHLPQTCAGGARARWCAMVHVIRPCVRIHACISVRTWACEAAPEHARSLSCESLASAEICIGWGGRGRDKVFQAREVRRRRGHYSD